MSRTHGRRIFSGSLDGTVKVWDTATGHETLTLWHSNGVSTVGVSADGKGIVSGGHDHIVTVWRAGEK